MNRLQRWAYTGVGTASAAATALVAKSALAQGFNSNINVGLGTQGPEEIVSTLINWSLGFLALIAVILALAGGFMWMTSGGSEEKIKKAKKLLFSAIAGLLIILAAWGLTIYAFQILGTATGTNTGF